MIMILTRKTKVTIKMIIKIITMIMIKFKTIIEHVHENRISVSYFSSVSAFNGKSKSPNLLSVKNVLSCSPICSRVGAE
jgi:hypothetical protein